MRSPTTLKVWCEKLNKSRHENVGKIHAVQLSGGERGHWLIGQIILAQEIGQSSIHDNEVSAVSVQFRLTVPAGWQRYMYLVVLAWNAD